MGKRKGLFGPAKHNWLADIITFKTISGAEKAAKKLINALKRGRLGKLKIGQKRALQIDQALNLAARRAKAASKNPKFKPKKRKQLRKISKIYDKAAEEASMIYKTKYKSKKID